jgi:hypothetical protein
MNLSKAVLMGALLALMPLAQACDGVSPLASCDGPNCPGEEPPPPGPGPAPEPPPSSEPSGTLWFHSLTESFDTPFFKAVVLSSSAGGVNPPLVHHGGLIAVDGGQLVFASTEGTGADLNLWVAGLDGSDPRQVDVSGCDPFGNIRDIDAENGLVAFVAEFRTNEADAELGICVGSDGAFRRLNHGDQINSESLVLESGWIYTALALSDEREQIVRIRTDGSAEEAIGPARPEDAEIQVEGILDDELVVVALGLNVLTPSITPDAFLVDTQTGAARELTNAGNVEDAVVCGGAVGVTYASGRPFFPDMVVKYFDPNGNTVGQDNFGVPVIDPYCS